MAFNGLRVIHGNLGDRLRYIMNPAKTEGGLLVAGINTTPEAAHGDMMRTKRKYGKLDKRQGYHIIQSLRQHRAKEVVGRRMNFSSDVLENFAGLPGVSQETCKRS